MNYKKLLIALGLVFIGSFVVYHSVYFEKLDAKRQNELVKNFKPNELVDYFWKNKLDDILKNALEIRVFDSLLQANPEQLIAKYAKTVGISSNYCFLIKGQCKVENVTLYRVIIDYKGYVTYNIPIKFIFNNTARDASGFFKVDNFANSIEFNAISSELNSRILREVINKKISAIKTGSLIKFSGAVEIDKEAPAKELDIVPLTFEVINK